MHFSFQRARYTEDSGWAPVLAPDKGYVALLSPRPGSTDYGLYLTDSEPTESLGPLSEQLHGLLSSASRFPPILAITRERLDLARPTPFEEIEAVLVAELERNLNAVKRENLFCFSRTTTDEVGYLARGEYYWLVGAAPLARALYWVADDFQIYEADEAHFVLTEEDRERLTRALGTWR